MPTYADAFLKLRITPDIETRAAQDVDAIRAFPASPVNWREKLIVLRAYIIACLEQGANPDDMHAAKLKAYQNEWATTLEQAQAAADMQAGEARPVRRTILLERT